jgi:hypothetical protein
MYISLVYVYYIEWIWCGLNRQRKTNLKEEKYEKLDTVFEYPHY